MDFTGERFVPGQGGAAIAYEHLHRYLFARRWARGRDVLDAASGAGYGVALLQACAARVWAVELDEAAAKHGRDAYGAPNTLFVRGDATRLPAASTSMHLLTAFEVLEHLEDQEGFLRELARVRRSDGVVLVSTPNRAVYSDCREYRNPFHFREFYRDEFLELLRRHFPRVVLFHQQLRAGSLIAGGPGYETEILTDPPPPERSAAPEPMYFLALCDGGASDIALPRGSAYLDLTDALMAEWSREVEAGNLEIRRLNEKVRELGEWAERLDGEVSERDRTLRELQQEMAAEIDARDRTIRELQNQFEERGRWALALKQEVEARDERLRRTNAALDDAAAHLARIRHAFLYRVLRRLRILPE